MEGNTLVFGLGFTSEYIVRSITERGRDNIDEVVLIGVFNIDDFRRKQADNALNDVKKFLDIINVKYKWKYVDVNKDFAEILYEVANELSGKNNLEFYLIGGMRIINFVLYYYATLAKRFGLNVRVFNYTEDMSKKYELPVEIPRRLTDSEAEILKLFKFENSIEISIMADRLQKTLSTISKQVSEMEEEGFLECTKTRPKTCRKTILGRIALTFI
ncbi:CRISPR locus-related DNA-binding protein [Sulfolobus islandicus L.S.2.15]|uniref:CRISPR locus-related DNA-binding protein n=1 Tax=Saccharolobus islandicus (strain L.S.2.15 / Lassen \|nr:CRISPR-associated CARF protein Csa3 [Sulfolobus islandicus]ACP34584.1 CRISPR locus-related DNA-binding protein [Sulfolobus islandicus L.S.2.15]